MTTDQILLGVGLIWIFSLYLGWLPTYGSGTAAQLVLPTVTLAAFTAAKVARVLRGDLLESFGADWVRTAQAKGVPTLRLLIRHALRYAALPTLALLTVEVSYLVSGAVVVETLFAYDGIGKQLVDAVYNRDYPVVFATLYIFSLTGLVIGLSLAVLAVLGVSAMLGLWRGFVREVLALIGWIVVMVAIGFGMSALGVGGNAILLVDILLALLMGFEAASLRRWTGTSRRRASLGRASRGLTTQHRKRRARWPRSVPS